MIPYGRQDIAQDDIDEVVRVLHSDFLTQGPAVGRFEKLVAERVGARHAIAVNSATGALHVACLALDLGPGDWLWTVPNTFVASANCARYCGAQVDFVDIDPLTWSMSVAALRDKLLVASRLDRLPKVVAPVHFGGQPTEQDAIRDLSREYGFKVLEDASHSIGASRQGEPVGSCKWSDVTVFSFHPVKIITTGEGGMALTNDAALAERMMLFRSHGITRDPARFTVVVDHPPLWHYEQHLLGFNYRLTDIQAALGLSQLTRLSANIDSRNRLAARYDAGLAGLPLELPTLLPGNRSAFHLYVVRLAGGLRQHHRQIFDALRTQGCGVNVHYEPVHLQPYYRALGFAEGQFPAAEVHGRSAITLPLYARLTAEDQDHVMAVLTSVMADVC